MDKKKEVFGQLQKTEIEKKYVVMGNIKNRKESAVK
jgi:hypothetical protein